MAKEQKDNSNQKRYIAQFAYNEFKRKGIKAVKMDDLASSLGISKRTIYELFEDKESLLVEGLKNDLEQNKRYYNELINESDSFFDSFLKWLSVNINQIRGINCNFLIDLTHYQKVQDYFNQQKDIRHQESKLLMERGISEGVFRNDIDYDILIKVQELLKQEMINRSLVNESNLDTYFKSVQLVILRGVCTDKGLQILNKYEF
ncbi:MAG: TetR/AcrR family transcriptional regulator [Bacteroidaceae bacterium]|nr:TetR/AcrR family transcriptional regulator [Bacteroidaceae bacterium]